MKPFTTTARTEGGQASQRVIAGVAIVIVHLVVIVVLAQQQSPLRTPPVIPAMVVTMVLAPQPPAPTASEVPMGTRFVAPAFEIAAPTPPVVLPCNVLTALAESLRRNPAALSDLAPLTQEATHAIMAWSGTWSDRFEVQALRHAALTTLTAVRADCLDEQMIGPRLIFVEVGATTVTVSFGSGAWSWHELILDERKSIHIE